SNDLKLDTLDAGGALRSAQSDGPNLDYLQVGGTVAVANLFRVGAGNIDIRTDQGITLGQVGVPDGANIDLTSGSGPVSVASVGNAGFGTPFDITVDAAGAATLTHAEAQNNLTVDAASFTTGLDSIIAGGDIVISTTGDSALGNSSAGGLIDVNAGGAIDFASLMSGTSTSLSAGTGIAGGDATSGTGMFLTTAAGNIAFGRLVAGSGTLLITSPGALTGTSAQSNLDLILSADAGGIDLGNGTAARNVAYSTSNGGNIAVGATTAGGRVDIRSAGNLTLTTTNANGTYVEVGYGGGVRVEGTAFADVAGSAALGTIAARDGIGVNAASVSNGALTSGEDILVVTTGGATLASAIAGDDVDIRATGAASLDSGDARGTARDDRQIVASDGFFITGATPGGANLTVTASGATLGGHAANDVIVTAGGGGIGASTVSAGRDVRYTTSGGGNIIAAATTAGDDILASSAGTATLTTATTTGSFVETGYGVTPDGSNIVVNAVGAATIGHGDSANDILVDSASFSTGLSSLIAAGDILISTTGDSTLGNSTAGGAIGVDAGGGIAFTSLSSGSSTTLGAGAGIAGGSATAGSFIDFSASDAIAFDDLTAGSTLSIDAGGAIDGASARANGGSAFFNGDGVTLGAGAASLDLIVSAGGGGIDIGTGAATRNVAYGTSNGGDITAGTTTAGGAVDIQSAGNLALTTTSANGTYAEFGYGAVDGTVFADIAGSASLGNVTGANGIGVNAASITGGSLTSGEDIVIMTTGDATLASAVAGDDVSLSAGGALSFGNGDARGTAR
ncbi:MAG: hypothetical protein H0X36_15210, partial [Sphingomonadaceae bacterium]|nr:hypothetical protein [Sphingomonadaceae bacterium]